ncbi:MAG: DUF1707 SHOCT-like domain-containing protein [Solirubrobacteraceae bacterium]
MSDPPRPESAPGTPVDRPAVPALRASDAEREQTVNVLREAAGEGRLDVEELDERLARAYSLKTRVELEALTADVVVTPANAPATLAGVVVRPGDGGTRMVVSIMAGHDRTGHWRIAPRCNVVNIMGGTDLDLTQVELSDHEATITAVSIMGGMSVRQGCKRTRAEERRERELNQAQRRDELGE